MCEVLLSLDGISPIPKGCRTELEGVHHTVRSFISILSQVVTKLGDVILELRGLPNPKEGCNEIGEVSFIRERGLPNPEGALLVVG